jgi:hypothetical protein
MKADSNIERNKSTWPTTSKLQRSKSNLQNFRANYPCEGKREFGKRHYKASVPALDEQPTSDSGLPDRLRPNGTAGEAFSDHLT